MGKREKEGAGEKVKGNERAGSERSRDGGTGQGREKNEPRHLRLEE